MLPVPNTRHVAEGLDRLLDQYKRKRNIEGILRAVLTRVQEAEDALWAVSDSQRLDKNPTGQALRQLADLVGAPVGLWSDPQLLFLVRVWVLARRSKGRSVDLLAILAQAFGGGFAYEEYEPAALEAWVPSVPDEELVTAIAQALRIARPPGVHAVLAWGTWPTATFFFGDSASGASGSGLRDSVSGANAKGLLSAIEV